MRNVAPIRLEVTRVGQPYVDEPVYQVLKPRPELCTPIAQELATLAGRRIAQPKVTLTGHKMKRLRWMEPDGKGGLRPKGA